MNYGADAADQIVRYYMEGIEHSLRITGSVSKNVAIFVAAVMKDQKKTRGKTRLVRMLKEQKPMKFFTVPQEYMKEFAKEAKARGLLYVVIKDKKNPKQSEVMVFAEDAAKVNRVMDKLNLDFVKSETGEAVPEKAPEKNPIEPMEENPEVHTEKVFMPEGTIEFEVGDLEEEFRIGEPGAEEVNFTQAEKELEEKNPSVPSSHNIGISSGHDNEENKHSVRKELDQIKKEKEEKRRKQNNRRPKNKSRSKKRRKRKVKGR